MRDGSCVTGRIETFDNRSVTIGSLKLYRESVVRIGDGKSVDDHDPIYSGRSSWSDLQRSDPNKHERIQLDLKNHLTRMCRNFSPTEVEAICDSSRIEKSEVTRGYYIRLAPADEWELRASHENVTFLEPRTWFDYAFFPRIKVLLYDDSLPQENAKVACKVP